MQPLHRILLLSILVVAVLLGCAPAQTVAPTQPAPTSAPPTTAPTQPAPTNVPATTAPTAAPASSLSGKIRVATWQEAPQEKFYQETFALFKKQHPNVEIEYITAPAGEYPDKLNVMLAGGDPADVYLSGVGFPFTYEGVQANTYADLTERYNNELKGQLLDSAVTTWTVDGKLYGLPINVAALGNICYNKTLFDAAGVKYPTDNWTGDDFRAAAKQLVKRDASGKVTVWGALPWPDFFYISVPGILTSNGGAVFSPDGKKWVAGIEPNLSKNVAALEPYVAMAAVDKSVPTPGETREMGFGEGMFERSELAMRHCGFFHLPIYNKVAGLEYGVALNDSWRVKPYVGISPLGLVISAQSKNPDAAWAFAKFVTSSEVQTLQFQQTGNLPTSLEVLNSQTLLQDPVFAHMDLKGWIDAAMQRGESLPGPHDTPVAPFAISAVWEKYMDRAWKGEISVKDALTQMQPEMEKLFP
jgi:multiple sugar transport system substrate-binding protein